MAEGDAVQGRKVMLRAERNGADSRYLWAHLDEAGNLLIEGQDLGPGTAIVSSDGEYEWITIVDRADLPALVALLGGEAGSDVLDVVARYVGRAYELETLMRDSNFPITRHIW